MVDILELRRLSVERSEQASTSSMKETIRATSRDLRGFRISKDVPPWEMVATACVLASIESDAWKRDRGGC